MMLTTKARYAIMSVVELASSRENTSMPMNLSEISSRLNIALSYLEQIFNLLRKSNIVRAIKGPGGGYVLNHQINMLKISEIIDAVDENIRMTRCTSAQSSGCTIKGSKCQTHKLWEGLGDNIRSYFSSISIEDIISGKA